MNIIYKSPFDHQSKILWVDSESIPLQELKKLILLKEELSNVDIDFSIVFNGKTIIDNILAEDDNVFIQLSLPLYGGKGGFGSMLRAIGAQIEKTTNREACRDLSGRRLRDVNEEKRLKDWIKKQSERKEEEKKKKDKLKRMAEGNLTAKCEYNDNEFEKFRTEIPDIVEESINQGLKQDSNNKKTENLKRKIDQDAASSGSSNEDIPTCSGSNPIPVNKKVKKHNLWLGIDVDSDSDSDTDSEDQEKQPQKN